MLTLNASSDLFCPVVVQVSTTGLLPRKQAEYINALQDLERSTARAKQLYREV